MPTFTNTQVAATLAHRSKGYVNAISIHVPLFEFLRGKGRYTKKTGRRLEWNVEGVLDTNEASYDGYDDRPVYPSDAVVTALADWKHYSLPIAYSGPEKRMNSGTWEKFFDLVMQKETNARESLQQQMSDHIYLDGTGNSSKRITGLQAIISATPTTGTLFNIAASNSYWQNRHIDTADLAYDSTTSIAHQVDDLENMRMQCGRQKAGGKANRFPDLIICTELYHQYYQQVLQRIGQRFVDTSVGDPGFKTLQYKGAAIIHDTDMPQDAGSDEQAYLINSKYLEFCYHPDANFRVTEHQEQADQDAFSAKILWMGELTCQLRGKHGLQEGVQAPGSS